MTQLDTAKDLYPSVADSDFETYAVPATGHAINFRKLTRLSWCFAKVDTRALMAGVNNGC